MEPTYKVEFPHIVKSYTGDRIATIAKSPGPDIFGEPKREKYTDEYRQNVAKLLSAAPEMLETLQMLKMTFDHGNKAYARQLKQLEDTGSGVPEQLNTLRGMIDGGQKLVKRIENVIDLAATEFTAKRLSEMDEADLIEWMVRDEEL